MPMATACLLPELLAVLAGNALPSHPGMVRPAALDQPVPPPLPESRDHLVGTFDNHLDSEHFCVTWQNGEATQAIAQTSLNALEAAWEALVGQRGWEAPESSEDWLLSVYLDPTLDASGFTGRYVTETGGIAYPYIWLNPQYADQTDFFRSVTAHEFNHALQWRLRPRANAPEDAWYWEASAEWGAELALPNLDVYGWQSYWYAQRPEVRYSSMEEYHQYGMFPVNAFLEEFREGPGSMKATWLLGEASPRATWDGLLGEAAGEPAADLWAAWTSAFAEASFSDSDVYERPASMGRLEEGVSGELAYLGTHYYRVRDDGWVAPDGEVILGSPWGTGGRVEVRDGEWLTVTGTNDGFAGYTLFLVEDPFDTGDPNGPGMDEPKLGCACGSSPFSPVTGWLLFTAALCVAGRRSERPSVSPC
jgi:hypothetical protein